MGGDRKDRVGLEFKVAHEVKGGQDVLDTGRNREFPPVGVTGQFLGVVEDDLDCLLVVALPQALVEVVRIERLGVDVAENPIADFVKGGEETVAVGLDSIL